MIHIRLTSRGNLEGEPRFPLPLLVVDSYNPSRKIRTNSRKIRKNSRKIRKNSTKIRKKEGEGGT